MTKAAKLSAYPSLPVIRRTVEQARAILAASGLDLAGYEVAPGGLIRILTPAAFAQAPKDEFETWERDGKL